MVILWALQHLQAQANPLLESCMSGCRRAVLGERFKWRRNTIKICLTLVSIRSLTVCHWSAVGCHIVQLQLQYLSLWEERRREAEMDTRGKMYTFDLKLCHWQICSSDISPHWNIKQWHDQDSSLEYKTPRHFKILIIFFKWLINRVCMVDVDDNDARSCSE